MNNEMSGQEYQLACGQATFNSDPMHEIMEILRTALDTAKQGHKEGLNSRDVKTQERYATILLLLEMLHKRHEAYFQTLTSPKVKSKVHLVSRQA